MAYTSTMLPGEAFVYIRGLVPNAKATAQNALSFLSGNSVDSNYVYSLLAQLGSIKNSLNTYTAVVGLNTYATNMGYTGTFTTDCQAIVTAVTNCINWVVTNFPASGGFVLDNTLNADGSVTPRSFTSTQTAGLQTNLTSLINTIN